MRGRPRGPSVVYVAIAVAMLVLLAAFALSSRQPPPPTIAEFAPQAVEQITDSPTDQSSSRGAAAGVATPLPSPAAVAVPRPVVDVARVRRCVGDPPRQIEDPQSPPCVPYWSGNNGGTTSRGVTRDEIRVYVPTSRNKPALFDAFARFFNARFELYGRKVVLVYGTAGGDSAGNGPNTPENQQAEAVRAESQNVFGSLMFRTAQGFFYHEEAARRGIVSVVAGIFGAYEHSYLAERRPFLWSYLMESDVMFAGLGRWGCARLANRMAAYAGDVLLQGSTRSFGVILQTSYNGDKTGVDPLLHALERCGSPAAKYLHNPIQSTQGETYQATGQDPAGASNAMLQMKQANVTSIFCLCQPYTAGGFMKAASNQAYHPEWLLSSYGSLDFAVALQVFGAPPADQLAQSLGVTFQPPQVAPSSEPFVWAQKEADPSATPSASASTTVSDMTDYRPFLLLASGLQMAGPNLTPLTFERALHRTVFPNPEHPNRPGKVGFAPATYAMTTDAAEFWWSNTDLSPHSPPNQGTYCYLDSAARRDIAQWPEGDAGFFKPPCVAQSS